MSKKYHRKTDKNGNEYFVEEVSGAEHSASSLIACHDMGFEYLGFELDEDYYNIAQDRIKNHRQQLNLI